MLNKGLTPLELHIAPSRIHWDPQQQKSCSRVTWGGDIGILQEYQQNLCYKNRQKIAKTARNRDFFIKTIFSQKIAEKIVGQWKKSPV
jgi:hypothetical protein